ncbi:hypothetical protein [Granulicella arctica]|uniref:hypothetical protein n=1 Tax=Granulicella arctica TaxID=940613 RepID=UPI0021E02661|nr:hypothetical protein [Granulicella arctica]
MADLNFSQSERRNLFLPIAIAVLALAGIAAYILHRLPSHDADLTITRTNTWQAHTIYKTDTIVVGQDKAQDDLYVLATLHVDNRLHIPIFIKDVTATLTTASGDLLETSAAQKTELPPLYETFPALKPLASPPLLRETTIPATQPAEGMVLLHFPGTQDDWTHRKEATLTVAFYHQPPQTITFAKP